MAERPIFNQFEQLVIDSLRKQEDKLDKLNDKQDGLSLKITRLEDNHIANSKAISGIESRFEKHIEEHKSKKHFILTTVLSLITGGGLFSLLSKMWNKL